MTRTLKTTLAIGLLAAIAGCGDTSPTATSTKFTVAVIGDSPYGIAYGDTAQFKANPAFIAALSADSSLSMALHVGDIHSGKEFCTESYNLGVFNQWKGFRMPLVYVPGDNEWADCHKAKEGGGTYNPVTTAIDYVTTDGGSYAKGDPLANLGLVRSLFFSAPGKSLGANPITLHSQALEFDPNYPADAQFVENVWYESNSVMFVTLNVPGGSNNNSDIWYGTPTMSNAQANEIATRTAANLRWIDTAFARAVANKNVAVVLMIQADMWDQDGVNKAHLSEYRKFIDRIATNTAAYGKPVLLINGDSHNFRVDNPLMPGAACLVEAPATGTVGAALVAATDAVACNDPSVDKVAATYHKDVYGTANASTDPYTNQPGGYKVSNFRRIVVHTNPANPLEYLRLTIDPSVATLDSTATSFGPFSWARVKP
ncbi:MAG: hypothetical protein WCG13_14910 [Burkholderiales bacterium]|jgi:hypothetical protein